MLHLSEVNACHFLLTFWWKTTCFKTDVWRKAEKITAILWQIEFSTFLYPIIQHRRRRENPSLIKNFAVNLAMYFHDDRRDDDDGREKRIRVICTCVISDFSSVCFLHPFQVKPRSSQTRASITTKKLLAVWHVCVWANSVSSKGGKQANKEAVHEITHECNVVVLIPKEKVVIWFLLRCSFFLVTTFLLYLYSVVKSYLSTCMQECMCMGACTNVITSTTWRQHDYSG